ncbi:probable U3 small nucleolar RNA-associated protein 11, partial [Primulina eburnea]
MSSLRNAIPRKAHKERAQPHLRRKFGLLEKHKDYVIRARAYHQKEQTLLKLKEKAALRNPDEFYFKMIKTKTVGRVHKPESQANKYNNEELMLMKTQDIGYILQKLQTEKRFYFRVSEIERLNGMLHSLDNQSSSKHVYFSGNREETREVHKKVLELGNPSAFKDLPKVIL